MTTPSDPAASAPRPAPAAPRPAATVVVLAPPAREPGSERACRLFMVRRSAKSPFMPDALVFPGGAVDPGDGTPGSDAAFERAARREAQEEAALDLSETPLRWFDTWTTPSREGRRYLARFFVARIPETAVSAAVHDGHETTEGIWDTARGFLRRWREGEVDLPPPTLCVLMDVATRLERLEARTPDEARGTVLPRLQARDNTVAIVLPHASEYADLDGDGAPMPARAHHLPTHFIREGARWVPWSAADAEATTPLEDPTGD